MKHTHEKLADTEPKLEEDIIVPHRRKVFEDGGMSLEPRTGPPSTSPRPERPKQARGTGNCLNCGVVISAHRLFCLACKDSGEALV